MAHHGLIPLDVEQTGATEPVAADGIALVEQRGHRHPPALANVTKSVVVGYPDVVEEDLVECGATGHLAQWSYLDALGAQVNHEHREVLVPWPG
uniref:Unannotated protein n=1 Tax=freshwater metagenome TaxID=449393 RepID=A0A6J7MX66_9ZZZZ